MTATSPLDEHAATLGWQLQPGDMEYHLRGRIRAAAMHARRVYPGDVGELLGRELLAYAEFGRRFATDALIPRLAETILAMPTPIIEKEAS